MKSEGNTNSKQASKHWIYQMDDKLSNHTEENQIPIASISCRTFPFNQKKKIKNKTEKKKGTVANMCGNSCISFTNK